MLTEKELLQIKNHGLSEKEIRAQLEIFSKGIPFADVVEAATIGNGIEVFSKEKQAELVALFEEKKEALKIVKFVPASGAATRMFKDLHQFLEDFSEENSFPEYIEKPENSNLKTFFKSKNDFAFTERVLGKLNENHRDFDSFSEGKQNLLFVKTMFDDTGFNFNETPKGLVPFHKYPNHSATAFEEQLFEAAFYSSVQNVVKIHFTISEEHEGKFKKEFENIKNGLEKKSNSVFEISYSFQQKSTDTIAATSENLPFKDENGNLVFRPSGHGALLKNLNGIDADIIFIKNIDNVVPQNEVETIAFYKKVLAGKLIELQTKIFRFVKILSKTEDFEIENEAISFLQKELNSKDKPKNRTEILVILDRPIRVCGVVKNTGAPGGGPFWVKNGNREIFLQIVETAQIDLKNADQKSKVEASTHFNPVDLVCGIQDYKGEKFDLQKFLDPNTGFISTKSFQGKPLKALELPGLWNGAMANWNTVFVEVPLETFNPVKTVNDLLRETHIPKSK